MSDEARPTIISYDGVMPNIAKSVFVAPSAVIVGNVTLEEESSVWFQAVIRGDLNGICIGKGTNVQDGCIIHVTHERGVSVGEGVTIGHGAILHGCTIESRCLVGMRSTVLDGSRIGEESIVAAGSLVTEDKEYPPRSLIMGTPAKVVRSLSADDMKTIFTFASSYLELAKRYMGLL